MRTTQPTDITAENRGHSMVTKHALITGAARGIGLATAKRFLADGFCVAMLDIDDENLARSVAAINAPERTLALTCDVATVYPQLNPKSCETM